jgi:anti-anti-sigma factor
MSKDEDRGRAAAPSPDRTPGAGQPGSCTCETPPGDILLYRLRGDLGLDGVLEFDKPLDGFRAVLVDLTEVGFFCSTALNALLRLRLDAEEHGLTVHLSAPPPITSRVLEITGSDALFPRHTSLDAALRALG